jgi:hypothetical protein
MSRNAIDLVLSRLSHAREIRTGWRACCPGHNGSNPSSLSIREGDNGVLIHCFTGCSTDDVVRALGLEMRDLFNEPKAYSKTHQQTYPKTYSKTVATKVQRPPTSEEVERALRAHLQRQLDGESAQLGYVPPITSRHHNAARRSVHRLLGVPLRPVQAAWWEHAQYDNDPLWQTFAERALQEILWECNHAEPMREDYCDAQERAASWIRSEAKRLIQHDTERAA